MRENEISSPKELDAILQAKDINKRDKLWRRAEGKSFSKFHLFGLLVSWALIGIGLYGLLGNSQFSPLFLVILGMILVVNFVYQSQQRQIDALREIVRALSRRSR